MRWFMKKESNNKYSNLFDLIEKHFGQYFSVKLDMSDL